MRPWVLTIDGPSGSGKSTLARRLSQCLHAEFLPSGLLYRLVGYWSLQGMSLEQMPWADLHTDLTFQNDQCFWQDRNMTVDLGQDQVAMVASKLAQSSAVRACLLPVQRAWRISSPLVAEGRDMGSVVFPNAEVKWFIECSLETRVKRRFQQLLDLGIHASLEDVAAEIIARDARDQARHCAPLQQPLGALILENDSWDLEAQVQCMLEASQRRLGVG